jgi:hypothetical protein
MTAQQRDTQERRGLRFPFEASAEVLLDGRTDRNPARVTELSFRGCFLEISTPFKEQQRLRVKIFHEGKYFEASAEVLYVRPNGVGVVFGNVEPHFRKIIQAWILTALDNHSKSQDS